MNILQLLASSIGQAQPGNPEDDLPIQPVQPGQTAAGALPDPGLLVKNEPLSAAAPVLNMPARTDVRFADDKSRLRGTLGDIVGTLGDALLVGSGRMKEGGGYWDLRRQKQEADAMEVYRSPDGSQRIGLEMLNRVNPAAARELELQTAEQNLKNAEAQGRQDLTNEKIAYERLRTENEKYKALTTVANYARALNENSWGQFAPMLHSKLTEYGAMVPPPPAKFDQGWVDMVSELALKEDEARRLGLTAANNASLAEQRRQSTAQGAARTAAYLSNTANQIENRNRVSNDREARTEIQRNRPGTGSGRQTGTTATPLPPGATRLGSGRIQLADGTILKAR